MDIALTFAAFYGMTFLLKDSSLLATPREALAQRMSWFAEMIQCSFCTGAHAGWMVYLLSGKEFEIRTVLLWMLASAAFSFAVDTWLLSLEGEDPKDEEQ